MKSTTRIMRETDHRPWPLPSIPWVMFQSWRRLLFAHWSLPVEQVRPLVPPPLVLDTFDGRAWVGLTPFRVVDLRLRCLPALPGISRFSEMNLRTYVRSGDRAGVYFFSLDAASRAAVVAARTLYRLPYRLARMRVRDGVGGGSVVYRSRREDDPGVELVARYRPEGGPFHPTPESLEHFLTERYALYTVLRSGTALRTDIHHRPWSLQKATAELERNTVPGAHGIDLPAEPPLLHFAERQDTLVWPPTTAV